MAWIESHQNLKDHPKLLSACQTLACEKALMIGHLHILWWWCMDYALDGDLSRYSNAQIADACGWRRDHDSFIGALVNAGFIDQDGDKKAIHDWFDFCGEIVKKRLERKAERQKKSAEVCRSTLNSAVFPPTNQTLPTRPTSTPAVQSRSRFVKPTAEQVNAYAAEIGFTLDGHQFCDYYESKGWLIGKAPMRSWQAAVRTWKKNGFSNGSQDANGGSPSWMK